MRIGLYHEPVHTDGRGFDTYGPYARYVLEFARHFDHVTVFAPVTDQPTYFSGCPLAAANITVVPLPFFMTHIQAYRHTRSIARRFRAHCDELDAVNCRCTAPLAYLLWWMTRKRAVPFIYHYASDAMQIIARSPKYRGLYRWFALAAYSFEFAIQKHILRGPNSYSFADGEAMTEKLRRYTPNVETIMSSTLTAEDYHLRADSCTGPVVRVLYVGYLRNGKGLEDLLDAAAILRAQGRSVELELAGEGELLEPLRHQARRLGIEPFVHFRGYLTMGPALNALYNSCDIFALPSLSEGSPRVVLEARGHSLPVVATDVGNIAKQLDGGRRGVLVPRNDPAGLAAGLARIIDDGPFRRQCIQEGYQDARAHGVEAFVGQMARKIRELCSRRARRGER